MALKLEEIRALADRVAVSHGLDVVDVEYQGGGGKHRTLRVFIEKNEGERAKLRERVERLKAEQAPEAGERADDGTFDGEQGESDEEEPVEELASGAELDGAEPKETELDGTELGAGAFGDQDADEAFLAGLPGVSDLEFLSGITHGDCEAFSRDFGTVLDVEELVPGTEYLLEVSSPGLDRRLSRKEDYRRFAGSLVKLQTFEPVAGNRHWQGRLAELAGNAIVLEIGGKPERKAPKKAAPKMPTRIEIALGNVEKAHLVPEF